MRLLTTSRGRLAGVLRRTGLRRALLIAGALLLNCGAHATRQTDSRMLASVQAVALPGIQASSQLVDMDGSAAGLLERGFVHMQHDRHRAASNAFSAAIRTGNLNDAGRALAYWHIYAAESALGNDDLGAEALSSFVVVGQDVVDARNTLRYAVTSSGDFVERFALPDRLSHARALLWAAWAKRIPRFGRSIDEPVPVLDENEILHFLAAVDACAGTDDRLVARIPIMSEHGGHVEHALVHCDGEIAEYFLELVLPPH